MTESKQSEADQAKNEKLTQMYKNKTVYIPRKIAREKLRDHIGSLIQFTTFDVPYNLRRRLDDVIEDKIPKIMKKVLERKEYGREELPNKIRAIGEFVNSLSRNLPNSIDTGTQAIEKIAYFIRKRKKNARSEILDKIKSCFVLFGDTHSTLIRNWEDCDFRWALEKNLEYALENAQKAINKFEEERYEKKQKREEKLYVVTEKTEAVTNFIGGVKENLASSSADAFSKLQSKLSVLLAESIKKNILEAPPPEKAKQEAPRQKAGHVEAPQNQKTPEKAHVSQRANIDYTRSVSPSVSNYQSIHPVASNIATKNSINSNPNSIQHDTVTFENPMTNSPDLHQPHPPDNKKRLDKGKAVSTSVPRVTNDFEVQTGNGVILEKHLKSKKDPKPVEASPDKPTQQTQFQKYDSLREIEFKSSPQKRQNHSLNREIPHLPNLEELESSRMAEKLKEKERALRIGFEKNLSDAISKQIERRNIDLVSARQKKPAKVEDEEQQAVRYYFEFKRRIKQKVNFHEISRDMSHNNGSAILNTDGSLPPISGHVRDFSSDEYRSYRKPKKMLQGSPLTNRPAPHTTRKKSNPSADFYNDNPFQSTPTRNRSPNDRSPLDKSMNSHNLSYFESELMNQNSGKKKYQINSPTPIRSNNIEFEFYTPPKIVTHDAKNPGYPVYSDKKSKFESEIPRYFNKPLNYSPFEAVPRKPFVPKREDYLPRKHVNRWKVNYQGQVVGYNDVVKQTEAKANYDKKLKQEMAMWAV